MNTHKKVQVIVFILLLNICTHSQNKFPDFINNINHGFIKGADVSSLIKIEDHGGIFKENGIPEDALRIFKDHSINFIRLRIWHTPSDGYCGLGQTLQIAERIKNLRLKLLLDFHYSDTWADPEHQLKPAAWQNLSFNDLKDSVYYYTKNVITALKNQNTLPGIVQIGNEITCGMLWNDGRICDQYNTQQQWMQLAQIINEGIRGVNESLDPGDTVKIMIHIDRGGDNAGSRWFFDNLLAQNVIFDLIGLSFYPWWHGTLSDLEFNLNDLVQRYGKEIIVVETAYPWTLEWFDNTQNIVGNSSQLHQGYPATVEGQKNFLIDLMNLISVVPGNKGAGLFYWEPDWISAPTLGSPWENLTLFSFSGDLLSSISAFDSLQTNVIESEALPENYRLYQNYPNPFNPTTTLSFFISHRSFVTLKVYDVLGVEIATLVNQEMAAGSYKLNFNATGLSGGIYFYKLQSGKFSDVKKMVVSK